MDVPSFDLEEDLFSGLDYEQLEQQAFQTFAATQAATQGQPEAPLTRVTETERLQSECEHYKKLAQKRQGELSILKTNAQKASAEQYKFVANVHKETDRARQEYAAQLEILRERVRQLETDLTFQRQELQEAKSRRSKVVNMSTQRQTAFGGDGFKAQDGGHSWPQRKRKRAQTRELRESPVLDDSQAMILELPIDLSNDSEKRVEEPIRVQEQLNFMLDQEFDADKSDRGESKENSAQVDLKLCVCSALLDAKMPYKEGDLVALSSKVTREGENIGRALLAFLSFPFHELTTEQRADDPSFVLRIVEYLRIQVHKCLPDVTFLHHLLHLLQVLMRILPKEIARSIILDSSSETLLQTIQQIIWTYQDQDEAIEVVLLAADVINLVAQALNRDPGLCEVFSRALNEDLVKHVLCSQVDLRLRTLFLGILAASVSTAKGGEHYTKYQVELLDWITRALEDRQSLGLDLEELLKLRMRVLQCLYCIMMCREDGIELMKHNKYVVPRLVGRIAIEVDQLVRNPQRTGGIVKFIEAAVKFYRDILLDTEQSVLDLHWRHPNIRAAHVVAMTRLAFVEEDFDIPGISIETTDHARDLLEMALSPEEGEEVYALMVTDEL